MHLVIYWFNDFHREKVYFINIKNKLKKTPKSFLHTTYVVLDNLKH